MYILFCVPILVFFSILLGRTKCKDDVVGQLISNEIFLFTSTPNHILSNYPTKDLDRDHHIYIWEILGAIWMGFE